MPHSLTLPILAGLSLMGAGGGIYLGRSAVAEINPAYFGQAEDSFHADLVPYRSPDWAQVQAAEFHQAPVVGGLGSGCIGCRDYPVEYVPRQDPAIEVYAGGATATADQAQALLTAPEPTEASRDAEHERVEIYASYPVRSEQASAPAEEPEAPAEEVYAGTE